MRGGSDGGCPRANCEIEHDATRIGRVDNVGYLKAAYILSSRCTLEFQYSRRVSVG